MFQWNISSMKFRGILVGEICVCFLLHGGMQQSSQGGGREKAVEIQWWREED